MSRNTFRRLASLAILIVSSGAIGCSEDTEDFVEADLVSNTAGVARTTDPALVNPWGLAAGPGTSFWVANNGTGTATLYDANGTPQPAGDPLRVTLEPAGSAAPTGIVFNSADAFAVTSGTTTANAVFIFVSEDGRISAWSPDVDPTSTVVVVDDADEGAIYKGVALATDAERGPLLYVTNFSSGTVDVYDTRFEDVDDLGVEAFVDPNLPPGYAPFGIRAVGDAIWVTYAQQDEAREDDVPGPGNGFVSVFATDGTYVRRFASGGSLNAPWGITPAPSTFLDDDDVVLIGNFGDGRILAFDRSTGELIGPISDTNGDPIAVEGLWAIEFGNGDLAGDRDVLFFTAGTDDETGGLFGSITHQR